MLHWLILNTKVPSSVSLVRTLEEHRRPVRGDLWVVNTEEDPHEWALKVILHFRENTTPWNLVRGGFQGSYTHITYFWWVWTPDPESLSLFTWKSTSLTRILLLVIFMKSLWDLEFMGFLRGGRIIWPLLTLKIHYFLIGG